ALGLCYRHLGRWTDADRTWEAALQHGGDAMQAAALRLADLRIEGGQRATALGLYEKALRPVTRPADYRNALVDGAEARALVEAGCRAFREAGDHEHAHRLAVLYGRIAAPPERLGEAWYRLAEAERDEAARVSAYQKCIEYPGPFAYEARYELARIQLARGQAERAEETLQHNLEQLRLKPEVPAYERSL